MKYEPLPSKPIRPYAGLRFAAGLAFGLFGVLLIVAILFGSELVVQELVDAILYQGSAP